MGAKSMKSTMSLMESGFASRSTILAATILGLTLFPSCGEPSGTDSADAICPVTPVPFTYLGAETWELGAAGPTEVSVYRARLAFDDCPATPGGEVIVRGSGAAPAEALGLGIAVAAEPDPETGAEYPQVLATESLTRSMWGAGSSWVITSPIELPSSPTGEWYVGIEKAPGDPYTGISVEFQYDCPCSRYDRRTDQTMDHSLLDLKFDPDRAPSLLTAPRRPGSLSPFEIRWRTFYEHELCVDPLGESGDFLAEIVIWNETAEVDRFEVTVPSIPMGALADFSYTYYPGLEEGAYSIEVQLNSGSEARAHEGPGEAVLANNTVQGEFHVDSCTCPPHLGDLGIRDLTAPEQVPVGTTAEVTWSTCYFGICGSDAGESGRVLEQIKISRIEGTFAQKTTLDEIPTIAIGDCVSRSAVFPGRLPAGAYRVTVRLDPTSRVTECEHASQKNERASVFVRVVDPEEQ